MVDKPENLKILMVQLEQDPSKGGLRQSGEVEFVNLQQMIYAAQKTLKVRDALLDGAVGMLYVYWVVSDSDLAAHLNLNVTRARQTMLFITGQLRDQVTLLQDNTRGWVMRLRWAFEGVGGS